MENFHMSFIFSMILKETRSEILRVIVMIPCYFYIPSTLRSFIYTMLGHISVQVQHYDIYKCECLSIKIIYWYNLLIMSKILGSHGVLSPEMDYVSDDIFCMISLLGENGWDSHDNSLK